MQRTLSLLALVVAPASLCGQGWGPVKYVGAGAGLVSPSGSFGDVDKVGWHLLFTAQAKLKGVPFSIDGVYGQTAHDGGVEGTSTLSGALANLVLHLGSETRRVRPFVLAGVGAVRVNIDVPGFGAAVATKSAFDAGAGVLVGGGPDGGGRRWFLIARYVSVATPKSTAFIPLTAGLVFPVGRH
jgi:hypothetical protein